MNIDYLLITLPREYSILLLLVATNPHVPYPILFSELYQSIHGSTRCAFLPYYGKGSVGVVFKKCDKISITNIFLDSIDGIQNMPQICIVTFHTQVVHFAILRLESIY